MLNYKTLPFSIQCLHVILSRMWMLFKAKIPTATFDHLCAVRITSQINHKISKSKTRQWRQILPKSCRFLQKSKKTTYVGCISKKRETAVEIKIMFVSVCFFLHLLLTFHGYCWWREKHTAAGEVATLLRKQCTSYNYSPLMLTWMDIFFQVQKKKRQKRFQMVFTI